MTARNRPICCIVGGHRPPLQAKGRISTMFVRHSAVLSVFIAHFLAATTVMAQAPAEPMPVYTGNIGGGLALTNGNTDTRNFNLTGAITRDPKQKSVIKTSGTFLRGTTSN